METSDNQPSTTQRKKAAKTRICIYLIVAICIIIPTIVLSIYLKQIITNYILKIVNLKPNTEGYKTWEAPPTIITRDYYLFNITNPTEIVTDPSSATVYLKETPPYSYSLSATKKHIQWLNDNKALSYSIYRLFTRHPTRFNPSSVNDTGTFVDLLRATFRTQFQTKPAQTFFDLGGMNAFYHRNALEQLEGFTSELFYRMQDKMTGPNIAKSGFIYRYNGSRTYNYTIKAGIIIN
jgi:hypothetical protein